MLVLLAQMSSQLSNGALNRALKSLLKKARALVVRYGMVARVVSACIVQPRMLRSHPRPRTGLRCAMRTVTPHSMPVRLSPPPAPISNWPAMREKSAA